MQFETPNLKLGITNNLSDCSSEIDAEEVEGFDAFGVPTLIKHNAIRNTKSKTWDHYRLLSKPIQTNKRSRIAKGKSSKVMTHLCVLCLNDIKDNKK